MSEVYFRVSGVDSNEDASMVFVWCRDTGADDPALLGSGHIAGAGGGFLPPGVPIGQFCVTFLLPSRFSAADIVVTDDKSGKDPLPDVTVTPLLVSAGSRSGGTIAPVGLRSAGAANAFPQPRQIVMARQVESES